MVSKQAPDTTHTWRAIDIAPASDGSANDIGPRWRAMRG